MVQLGAIANLGAGYEVVRPVDQSAFPAVVSVLSPLQVGGARGHGLGRIPTLDIDSRTA